MVEHRGCEPLTSALPARRAPSCANAPYFAIFQPLRAVRNVSLPAELRPHICNIILLGFRKCNLDCPRDSLPAAPIPQQRITSFLRGQHHVQSVFPTKPLVPLRKRHFAYILSILLHSLSNKHYSIITAVPLTVTISMLFPDPRVS